MGFDNKVAVITGGGSGIGEATARLFSERGASVAILDFDSQRGQGVADELVAGGAAARFFAVDVSDAAQVESAMAAVVAGLGRIDALVNSAGISTQYVPVADYPLEAWHQGIGINLSGSFYCIKYAMPTLLEDGGGAVVNLSSIMGTVAAPGGAAYVAGKHGVVGLTKAAALDYSGQGVRVNAVGPGVIDTPMTRQAISDERARAALQAATPAGRLGTAQDIARLIVFLCSEEADFITGAYYPIDGGYLLQ